MSYVLVFLLMVALDFMWAMYTQHVVSGTPISAAFASVGIVIFSAILTLFYVTNPLLILPAALGAYVGTFVQMEMRRERPRAPKPVCFHDEL